MNPEPVTETIEVAFTGLTAQQADGLACVACGTDYLRVRIAHRPVGRSLTGSQVFVCSPTCPDPAGDGTADTGATTAGGDAL